MANIIILSVSYVSIELKTNMDPPPSNHTLGFQQMAVISKASGSPCNLLVDHAVRKHSLALWIVPGSLVPVAPFFACWFLVSRKQVGRLAAQPFFNPFYLDSLELFLHFILFFYAVIFFLSLEFAT